jgi:hypothetical protein
VLHVAASSTKENMKEFPEKGNKVSAEKLLTLLIMMLMKKTLA